MDQRESKERKKKDKNDKKCNWLFHSKKKEITSV